MFFRMVYKSWQIFLPFCDNTRVWQTDWRTDRILITIPRLHYMQRGNNKLSCVEHERCALPSILAVVCVEIRASRHSVCCVTIRYLSRNGCRIEVKLQTYSTVTNICHLWGSLWHITSFVNFWSVLYRFLAGQTGTQTPSKTICFASMAGARAIPVLIICRKIWSVPVCIQHFNRHLSLTSISLSIYPSISFIRFKLYTLIAFDNVLINE